MHMIEDGQQIYCNVYKEHGSIKIEYKQMLNHLFDKILSGRLPRQGVKVHQRFRDCLRLHLQVATDGLVKPNHLFIACLLTYSMVQSPA